MNNMMIENFRASLNKKALSAGFDVSNLKIEKVTIDQTWGDRCGYVFFGTADDMRVATYFAAWRAKLDNRRGSYDEQVHYGEPVNMFFSRHENGCARWYRTDITHRSADRSGTIEEYTGVAVATTYYPCAD